jgi:23S rRNA pseudouridine2605 synthase
MSTPPTTTPRRRPSDTVTDAAPEALETTSAQRLQKILSAVGLASRRQAEGLIRAGRVTVNGQVVRELGSRADPQTDVIALDGERIAGEPARRTIVLHKPRGVVTTLADPQGRPTVTDLLGDVPERLYPVGRLDLQTSGLLLLTNDGELAAVLLHPRRTVERVYRVKVDGRVEGRTLARLRRGVRLPEGVVTPTRARLIKTRPTKTWIEVGVAEGRRHVVRRLCEALGHQVDKLARVQLGPITLGTLPIGAWRDVTPRELAALCAAAGLSREVATGAPPRRAAGRSPRTPPRPPARIPRSAARDARTPPREGPARGRHRRPRR